MNMVVGYLAAMKKTWDQLSYFYVTHSVRSSPSVGIFTSGRVGGGAARDDFGLGCTSIVIMITTTNADKVTGMNLSGMEQPYIVKLVAYRRPYACYPI